MIGMLIIITYIMTRKDVIAQCICSDSKLMIKDLLYAMGVILTCDKQTIKHYYYLH